MDLRWFENLALSSKRSLHNFGTQVPAAVVNSAMDLHHLDDSRKVRNTEIHQELTNLPWFENLALSSKRSLHDFGTRVPVAVVNGAIDSHHLDDSRKVRNTEIHHKLMDLARFKSLALIFQLQSAGPPGCDLANCMLQLPAAKETQSCRRSLAICNWCEAAEG